MTICAQAMRGSAMRRTKVAGLRRNLLLALEAGRRESASEDADSVRIVER